MTSWEWSSASENLGQFSYYLILLCSISTRHLKVVLGDQDLKKTESHEQTFRVEKILKYSRYNEKDDIPHNDIGKYPLSLLWASPLVEIWGLVTESSHDPSYPLGNPVSCIIYFPAFYV